MSNENQQPAERSHSTPSSYVRVTIKQTRTVEWSQRNDSFEVEIFLSVVVPPTPQQIESLRQTAMASARKAIQEHSRPNGGIE